MSVLIKKNLKFYVIEKRVVIDQTLKITNYNWEVNLFSSYTGGTHGALLIQLKKTAFAAGDKKPEKEKERKRKEIERKKKENEIENEKEKVKQKEKDKEEKENENEKEKEKK